MRRLDNGLPVGGLDMDQDLGAFDFRGRPTIDPNEEHEVTFWARKWGVSRLMLLAIVDQVGPIVKDVANSLGKSPK
jgi:hypothetical protein